MHLQFLCSHQFPASVHTLDYALAVASSVDNNVKYKLSYSTERFSPYSIFNNHLLWTVLTYVASLLAILLFKQCLPWCRWEDAAMNGGILLSSRHN